MDKKFIRTRECKFRAAETDNKKYIEGYFVVFGAIYDMGWGITESVHRNAFDKYLDNDIRVLCNHNSTIVLGRNKAQTATISIDDHGVYVRCEVNENDSDAMNVYARTLRGDINQASFGGYIVSEERTVDAKTGNRHYTITEFDIMEFSVCTFPAYEDTDVGARARKSEDGFRRWKEEMQERIEKWH
jgi:HK97 family phage prohead protease